MKSGPFLKGAMRKPRFRQAAMIPREMVVLPSPPRTAEITSRGTVLIETLLLGIGGSLCVRYFDETAAEIGIHQLAAVHELAKRGLELFFRGAFRNHGFFKVAGLHLLLAHVRFDQREYLFLQFCSVHDVVPLNSVSVEQKPAS